VADRIARGHLPGPELPFVEDGDLAAIAQPLDFLGLNYYSRVVMRAGADGRPEAVPPAPGEERSAMGWEDYPAGLQESLLRVHRDYAPRTIHVTENGAAYDDEPGPDGRIVDAKRIAYLRGHLQAARRALAQGVPLAGYFVWSLLDNFEWAHGFAKRFGLFAVAPASLQRIPKASAHWYRDVVAANAVDDASVPVSQGERRASRP